MTCRDAQLHLPLVADREPVSAIAPDVLAHVAECGTCLAQVRSLERLRASARRAISVAAPAHLSGRVRSALASQRRSAPHTLRWVVRVGAVAAAVMLALLGGSSLLQPEVRELVPLRAAQLVSVHDLCAVSNPHDPRRVGRGDPSLVTRKLHRDYGFVACVPNLSRDGFRLDGLCTCVQAGDARTFHAHYRPELLGTPIVSVFSIQGSAKFTDAPLRRGSHFGPRVYRYASIAGASFASWTEDSGTYAVVARIPMDDLIRLADGITVGDARSPESAGSIAR
ncbi:MAG: hypothetical protein HRU75_03195 [Planctomycetia bacterium]|nr:MAG: hypothetical protein HRU75_03195 [Planctomycetia bacterium]